MTGHDEGRRARRAPALLLAVAVVVVELALVALWVVFLTIDDGWTRTIWLAVGLLLLWQLLPRPVRMSRRARALAGAEAPQLHRLVGEVAATVGARTPSRVAVDTVYASAVQPVGYLGRTVLVVGLPQWTVASPEERVAVLAHELACAEVRRGPAGCLVRLADDLLTSARGVLRPPASRSGHDATGVLQATSDMGMIGVGDEMAGNQRRREAAAAVGTAGLSVVGAPLRLVQAALTRAWRPVLLDASGAADRAAAGVAGTGAVRSALLGLLPVPRGLTAAHNASRGRGADPFAAMATAGRPDDAELRRRLAESAGTSTDPVHPPTAERVAALEGEGAPGTGAWVDRGVLSGADAEVATVRAGLAARFAEELVHGRP